MVCVCVHSKFTNFWPQATLSVSPAKQAVIDNILNQSGGYFSCKTISHFDIRTCKHTTPKIPNKFCGLNSIICTLIGMYVASMATRIITLPKIKWSKLHSKSNPGIISKEFLETRSILGSFRKISFQKRKWVQNSIMELKTKQKLSKILI